MPSLENLKSMVAEKLDDEKREAWYATLDSTYAYGQIPLDLLTTKRCNFKNIGGESSGTYRFVTGFYGLTVMPKEFQKTMDNLGAEFCDVFVFIEDFLKVTKGTQAEHSAKVGEILQTLNEANLLLKATKCKFAKKRNRVAWVQFV